MKRKTWCFFAAMLVAGVLLAGSGNALGAEPVRQSTGTGSGPVQISPGVPQGTTSQISGPAAGKINPVAGAAAALNRGARENPQGKETPSPPKVAEGNIDPVPDQEKPAGQGANIGPISTAPGGVRPNKGNIDPHPGQVAPFGVPLTGGGLKTGIGGAQPGAGNIDPQPGSHDGSPSINCPPGTPINVCNPDGNVLKPHKPGSPDPRVSDSESARKDLLKAYHECEKVNFHSLDCMKFPAKPLIEINTYDIYEKAERKQAIRQGVENSKDSAETHTSTKAGAQQVKESAEKHTDGGSSSSDGSSSGGDD